MNVNSRSPSPVAVSTSAPAAAAAPAQAAEVSEETSEDVFIDSDAARALDLGRPSYLRTPEKLNAAVRALAKRHPDVVRVEDVGDSAEKTEKVAGANRRDILAMRIASPKQGEPRKPILLVT